MISITQETLIALRDAPRHLPVRPNGKRLHISACYRWISRGIKGIVLESVKLGGATYTSVEALQRFAEKLSRGDHAGPTEVTALSRSQAAARAGALLAFELGWSPPPEARRS